MPNDHLPICTLRSFPDYEIPYLTECTYTAGAKAYTLKMKNSIPQGRYLIDIRSIQQDLSIEGVSFPPNENRVTLEVSITDSPFQAKDTIGIAAEPSNIFIFIKLTN